MQDDSYVDTAFHLFLWEVDLQNLGLGYLILLLYVLYWNCLIVGYALL